MSKDRTGDTPKHNCPRCAREEFCHAYKAASHVTQVSLETIRRQLSKEVAVSLDLDIQNCPLFLEGEEEIDRRKT